MQLAFIHTHELLPGPDSVGAADRPVFAVGVQEGSELVLSTMEQAAKGAADSALGLPADADAGPRAVARWRRARLGLMADAVDATVANVSYLQKWQCVLTLEGPAIPCAARPSAPTAP